MSKDESPKTIDQMKPLFTADVLPIVDAHLVELLRSLTTPEWELQTVAPAWKVKDVAAHLLDTQLRKLSVVRDGYVGAPPRRFASKDEFVAFINQLNREGVALYRRLSPAVLIAMLELASRESAEFHQSLDPMAEAAFSVSWAGEERSMNWFDTARELTERWHHQQQIRLATNRPGIMTRELYYPVLDCFMRALPFTYCGTSAEPGTHLRFNVTGETGGSWYIYRDGDRWVQVEEPRGRKAAETTFPQEIAWRIFTKGIDRELAMAQTSITGNRELGSHVMSMVAIVG